MIPKAAWEVFHIAIAFAIATKLLFVPLGASDSHEAASAGKVEPASHAAFAVEIVEMDHVHNEDKADEKIPHTHQHNASDHSHDTPGTPPVFSVSLPDIRAVPDSLYDAFGCTGPVFGLDRPPRLTARA